MIWTDEAEVCGCGAPLEICPRCGVDICPDCGEECPCEDDGADNGLEPECSVCGCTASEPCPGGCVWAGPNLCSRCAREAA